MTSRFDLALKRCSIWQDFSDIAVYLLNLFAFLRCSEAPNVPLITHDYKMLLKIFLIKKVVW